MLSQAELESLGTIIVNAVKQDTLRQGILKQNLALRFLEAEQIYSAMFTAECEGRPAFVDFRNIRKGELDQLNEWLGDDLGRRAIKHLDLHGYDADKIRSFISGKASDHIRAVVRKDSEKE